MIIRGIKYFVVSITTLFINYLCLYLGYALMAFLLCDVLGEILFERGEYGRSLFCSNSLALSLTSITLFICSGLLFFKYRRKAKSWVLIAVLILCSANFPTICAVKAKSSELDYDESKKPYTLRVLSFSLGVFNLTYKNAPRNPTFIGLKFIYYVFDRVEFFIEFISHIFSITMIIMGWRLSKNSTTSQ